MTVVDGIVTSVVGAPRTSILLGEIVGTSFSTIQLFLNEHFHELAEACGYPVASENVWIWQDDQPLPNPISFFIITGEYVADEPLFIPSETIVVLNHTKVIASDSLAMDSVGIFNLFVLNALESYLKYLVAWVVTF